MVFSSVGDAVMLTDLDRRSISLYKKLIDYCSKVGLKEKLESMYGYIAFENQFSFTELNERCYEFMYKYPKEEGIIKRREELVNTIADLGAICDRCRDFFLRPRGTFDKKKDTRIGEEIENTFMKFLQQHEVNCRRGDVVNKNYPDFLILNEEGLEKFYIELKYLASPFIKIRDIIRGRECYEALTLDVDEKLEKQRRIVEEEIEIPVFYVFWLDFPCVKGIFFMSADEVYHYVDSRGVEYKRRAREGNFIVRSGRKEEIGHRDKAYLPLPMMKDFGTLYGMATSRLNSTRIGKSY